MAFSYGSTSEFKLENPPTDCIQRVRFNPADASTLLTASWDTTVRLYDVAGNQLRAQYNHLAPVLDAAFQGSSRCWSGGCDNEVKMFDFQAQKDFTVGYHTQPVRCVEYVQDVNLTATASWDKTLRLWDPRTADTGKQEPVACLDLPDKAYTMSVCGDKVIIGTAGRRINIWDLRNMTGSLRESLLKYQVRCIEAFPNKKGFVLSSIEGRVAVEYMDMAPGVQGQKYAFKCHRIKDPATGLEMIYPVNAISFHQKFNTFATGGSDGHVSIWDGQNKKRLVQFHRYPTSISSLSFSHDGSLLAIACSPMHAYEDKDTLREVTPPDTVFIRRVHEFEAKTKSDN